MREMREFGKLDSLRKTSLPHFRHSTVLWVSTGLITIGISGIGHALQKGTISEVKHQPASSSQAGHDVSLQVNQESSTSPKIDTGSNSSAASQNTSPDATTHVTVNGQNVPMPQNGVLHQTISTPNGSSDVNVTVQSQSSGSATNSSTTSSNIQVFSSSNSSKTEVNSP